jgi:predicted dehydrogenase
MHAHSYANCLLALDGVQLFGIADEDEQRGREAAEKYQTQYYKHYQDLLSEDIDAVIICTENSRHMEVTIAAAEAKKHVLCEKPLATSVDDARKMIEACEQNGVKLQTAFPVRYNAPVKRLKQMIDVRRWRCSRSYCPCY